MTISVVIPTYNRAGTINRALESVFNQTVKDIEVIVVDDGSTDNTEQVIRSRWGDAVCYIRQANQGACVARNTGASLARGEHIAFLDSDDEWLTQKLEKQLAVFDSSSDPDLGIVLCGRRIVHSKYEMTDLHGALVRGRAFETLISVSGVLGRTTSSFMVHRRVFEAGVRFDPGQKAMQDWDFLLAASRNFSVWAINEILLVNHREDGGDHVHTARRVLDGRLRIMEKYADELKARPDVLAKHHRAVASAYYRVGDMTGVRRHLRASQAIRPSAGAMFWRWLSHLNWWSFSASLRSIRLVGRTLTRLRVARMYGPFA